MINSIVRRQCGIQHETDTKGRTEKGKTVRFIYRCGCKFFDDQVIVTEEQRLSTVQMGCKKGRKKTSMYRKINFRLWMKFEQLFDGKDRLLSDSTNAFLNENWPDILQELKPVLRKAIGEILTGIVSPVFAKFPYDSLFLD